MTPGASAAIIASSPSRATIAARSDAGDLVGIGDSPELGEDRPGVDDLGRAGARAPTGRSRSRATCRRRRLGARRARRRSRRARRASWSGIPGEAVEVVDGEAGAAPPRRCWRGRARSPCGARRRNRGRTRVSPRATAGPRPTRCARSLRVRATTRRCRRAPSVRGTPTSRLTSRADLVELGAAPRGARSRRSVTATISSERWPASPSSQITGSNTSTMPGCNVKRRVERGRRDRCRRTASPRCRCRSRARGRSTRATAAGRRRARAASTRSAAVAPGFTCAKRAVDDRPPARRTGRVRRCSVRARRSTSRRSRRRSRAG